MNSNLSSPHAPVIKKIYRLASWWQRIFARLVDILLINGVGICFLIIFCASDKSINGSLKNIQNMQSWRFLISAIFCLIFYAFDFLIIPLLTKGRTFGLWVFRLQIHNLIPTKKFYINLFKREALVWYIFAFTNILVGIALLAFKPSAKDEFFDDFFNFTTSSNKQYASVRVWTTIIHALYMVGMLCQLFLIVNIIMQNQKRCFIDNISDTCVVFLKSVNPKDSQGLINSSKTTKKNYGLPGEIISEANEEIDSL